MVIAIKEKDEEINNLHNINKELLAYIDRLEEKHNLLNQAKDISQVAKKSRTLNTFLSQAKIALWFMKSFGLELTELNVMEQQTGIVHSCHSVDDTSRTDGSKGFDHLSSQDQQIEQVLFLLNKFCIGDSFYHELTMIISGLPKSYLV